MQSNIETRNYKTHFSCGSETKIEKFCSIKSFYYIIKLAEWEAEEGPALAKFIILLSLLAAISSVLICEGEVESMKNLEVDLGFSQVPVDSACESRNLSPPNRDSWFKFNLPGNNS